MNVNLVSLIIVVACILVIIAVGQYLGWWTA